MNWPMIGLVVFCFVIDVTGRCNCWVASRRNVLISGAMVTQKFSAGLSFLWQPILKQWIVEALGGGTDLLIGRIARLQDLSPLIACILLQLSLTLQITDMDCSALCESTVCVIFRICFHWWRSSDPAVAQIFCSSDCTALTLWSVQCSLC